MTEQLYLADQTLRQFSAVVVDVADNSGQRKVLLDQTAFYAAGGGQPTDTGTVTWDGGSAVVVAVKKDGPDIWHTIEGDAPASGLTIEGSVDWDRRHQLMRTHSAMHVLGGVIWNEYRVLSTGNNMEPLKGRIDYEFDPLPEGFAKRIQVAVNDEIAANRPIEVTFLPRETAVEDEDLIRTKVNMIPDGVKEIRVVDIVGLDKQADGGTHVASTGEIGTFTVVKTESKGKGNKRIRWELS
ncbi:MAG: alanyl-tRNA editing protein [Acidimicrobiales bacterium]|nr:alanyl-tRNA editing protein [Acidimicrobiales bacterium]